MVVLPPPTNRGRGPKAQALNQNNQGLTTSNAVQGVCVCVRASVCGCV